MPHYSRMSLPEVSPTHEANPECETHPHIKDGKYASGHPLDSEQSPNGREVTEEEWKTIWTKTMPSSETSNSSSISQKELEAGLLTEQEHELPSDSKLGLRRSSSHVTLINMDMPVNGSTTNLLPIKAKHTRDTESMRAWRRSNRRWFTFVLFLFILSVIGAITVMWLVGSYLVFCSDPDNKTTQYCNRHVSVNYFGYSIKS